MPLYDIECSRCERVIADVFSPLSQAPICPFCNARARIVIRPVLTVGPMPSKPLKMAQIGREFTSNSQWRDYQKANPDVKVLDKNDSSYDKFYTGVREKADKVARKIGYIDHEDRGRQRRKEKTRQARLTGQK